MNDQPTLFDILETPEAKRFKKYHEENPMIYHSFKRYALAAIGRGHKRLSSEFIFNIIRWETKINALNDDFKINNDMKPWYARLILRDYPQYKDFFETRKCKADEADFFLPRNQNKVCKV